MPATPQGLRILLGEEIEEMASEVIVPGGAASFAGDAALALVLAQQRGGHAAKQAQILGGGAVLEPAVVLPEDNVEHPVQPILDAPVAAGRPAQLLRAAGA